jgi:hypothetical protein
MSDNTNQIVAICYDLNRPGKNYPSLIDAIKSGFPTYWHHLDSTWLVKTNLSCVEVRDFLTPYVDSNDEILVVTLGGEAAWRGFNAAAVEWLKDVVGPVYNWS